jgi:mRNA interferase MazF
MGRCLKKICLKACQIYLINPCKINCKRPCVIISSQAMNNSLNTVLIAPLTHTQKSYPTRVFTNFKNEDGQVMLDQIRGVDKSRLKKLLGSLNPLRPSRLGAAAAGPADSPRHAPRSRARHTRRRRRPRPAEILIRTLPPGHSPHPLFLTSN